jgi:hypothetical protein
MNDLVISQQLEPLGYWLSKEKEQLSMKSTINVLLDTNNRLSTRH